MAISLPDARQLSDEVLQSLRLRALRGCELGSLRSRWRNCLASPGRPSRGGGPPTLIMAWKLSQATAPAARSAPVVPSTTGKRHGSDDPQRKKPRGGGDRLPVVDPQGRRRVDPQGVRDRHAGVDRRRVPRAVGLHCRGPAHHAKDQDPEEVRHWLEVTYPAIKARAAREDAEIHW